MPFSVDGWGSLCDPPIRPRQPLYPQSQVILPTPGGTALDPSFKNAAIALSNNNLTAASTSPGSAAYVRSTTFKRSGKVFFEATFNTIAITCGVGIAGANATTNSFPGVLGGNVGTSFMPGNNSRVSVDNIGNASSGGGTSTAGEIVSIAIDIGGGWFWATSSKMRSNGFPWNSSASADPATGVGGVQFKGSLGGSPTNYYLHFAAGSGVSVSVTMNFGGQPFNQAVPAGFTAWDGTPGIQIFEDSWHTSPSQPLLLPARTFVQVNGLIAAPFTPPSAPEFIGADKWGQPAAVPVLRPNPACAAQSTNGPAPGSAIVFGPDFNTDFNSDFLSIPQATADRWLPIANANAAQAARRAVDQPFAPVLAQSTAATPTGWWQPASQPQASARRLTAAVDSTDGIPAGAPSIGPELVSLDRWAQPLSLPTRRGNPSAAALAATGASPSPFPLTTSTEVINADKWAQPPTQPTRRADPAYAARAAAGPIPSPAPGAPEAVSPASWQASPSLPQRRATPTQPGGAISPLAPLSQIILADRWLSQISQPQALKRLPVASQGALALPSASLPTLQLDRWHQAPSQPRPRPAQPSLGAAFAPVAPAGSGSVVMPYLVIMG
jgi:hypothetical protein